MAFYSTSAGSSSRSSVPWTIPVPEKKAATVEKQVERVTWRQALTRIRHWKESCNTVALYSFNVLEEQLEEAHRKLDKMDGRRAMSVTYSDDYNFIVKYMPGSAHQTAQASFSPLLSEKLVQLAGVPYRDLNISFLGGTTFELGAGKHKEPDQCIAVRGTHTPTLIIEVGDSESLTQLWMNARNWLEAPNSKVQLVILISIDPPNPPSEIPRITIEHWKLSDPPRTPRRHRRVARCVWNADWTVEASPNFPLLLSDIYGPEGIPEFYGIHMEVNLDPKALDYWRRSIIEEYQPTNPPS